MSGEALKVLKVLTLHQPWASLIALGVKSIETRPNKTNVRGRIAIHAAKREPEIDNIGGSTGRDFVQHHGRECQIGNWPRLRPGDWYTYDRNQPNPIDTVDLMPLGAIVATADLVDCIPIVLDPEQISGPLAICNYLGDVHYLTTDNMQSVRRGEGPYGDYTPGRFAWLLSDVEPLSRPVPFKGGQGWSRSWVPS